MIGRTAAGSDPFSVQHLDMPSSEFVEYLNGYGISKHDVERHSDFRFS